MIRSTHPVVEEELMAYLDGELPVERARQCAAHLEQCSECQALATDLKAVYQQMSVWQVGPAPEGIHTKVSAALQQVAQPPAVNASFAARIRQSIAKNWMWGAPALAGLCLIVVLATRSLRVRSASQDSSARLDTFAKIYRPRSANEQVTTDLQQLKQQAEEATRQYQELEKRRLEQNMASSLANDSAPPVTESSPGATPDSNGLFHGSGDLASNSVSTDGQTGTTSATDQVLERLNAKATPSAPMIARTASVNLVAKDFDKARSELDAILRRHNGYAADLKLEAAPDQGRTLTASLRVPADQLDATLAEMKKLGRVEQESQGGEEVTEQYVDLNARLSNARSTEQRLLQVLNLRAGKMADILAVEREIARVRGEIEQMEAERKNLEHRVAYTSLDVQLKEEYKAALEVAPPSEFAQMRNSLVEGLESAMDSLLGFARFLFYAGPTLLLWALILFFPVRFFWRRWRASAPSKNSA